MATESGQSGSATVSASASGVWGRLSNLWRFCAIEAEEVVVVLVRSATGRSDRVPIGVIDSVGWQGGGLGARLWVETSGGRRFVVGGLSPEEAALVAAAVERRARALARAMETQGHAISARLEEWFAGTDYFRASQASVVRQQLDRLAGQSFPATGELTLQQLSSESREAFSRLQDLTAAGGFERARQRANEGYVWREARRVAEAMEGVSGVRPNPEQAEAVATDEDVTLVLAGAGTGKTAVIAGKVAHLVENREVAPERILVLAFNTKAAAEVRERLRRRYSAVNAATFHAFARRVVAKTGIAPSISPMATDDRIRRSWIDRTLESLLNDPERGEPLREFILYNLGEYRTADDFASPGDYFRYLQRVELRTLQGELVKSMEELKIANFLALHGVPYRYEPNYEAPTATRQHRQYRPDFHLPGHDIYIEHFGVDRAGQPPPYWSQAEREEYRREIEWKREIHRTHGTDLIETYSWQHRSGSWQPDLREQLELRGVRLQPRPIVEFLPPLRRLLRSSALSGLLDTFLHQAKSADYAAAELRRRAEAARDVQRANTFLDLFAELWDFYEAELGDEYDFDDLINQAAKQIRAGAWQSPYHHILVDESQDISRGQMKLLAAMQRAGTAYFLVGDDWQSIYRFAGSDVGLMRECEAWLGPVERRELNQSFRFGVNILEPSSAFVQRNPAQTPRTMRPTERDPDHGLTLVWTGDEQDALAQIANDLDRRGAARDASVLLLGRYRRPPQAGPRRMNGRPAERSTVHAAKGREADYVVVLDLANRRRGFPSQIADDPLLDLVAPPQEAYEFAEERRLFYVALTRARHGVYLHSNPDHPSAFVSELLRHHSSGMHSLGAEAAASLLSAGCPRCRGGRLTKSADSRSLDCSLRPQCDFRAPACPCHAGFLVANFDQGARCTNQDCRRLIEHCPRCRSGVLLERHGRHGPFWGCSRYGADPSCGYTRDSSAPAPIASGRSNLRARHSRGPARDRW